MNYAHKAWNIFLILLNVTWGGGGVSACTAKKSLKRNACVITIIMSMHQYITLVSYQNTLSMQILSSFKCTIKWILHKFTCTYNTSAATCEFKQCGILTSKASLCSLLLNLETPNDIRSVVNSHRIFKRLANTMIRLCACAWLI